MCRREARGVWFYSIGYIYYDNFAHMPAEKNTTYICVTAQKDARAINAADPKCVYKFSPAE